jgi:hypothetical protein
VSRFSATGVDRSGFQTSQRGFCENPQAATRFVNAVEQKCKVLANKMMVELDTNDCC